jgi:hypothetical protein
MERYFTPPLITFDTAPWAGYVSPIDGELIDSRSKRNEHMAKYGVVPFDEIAPDVERNKQRRLADAKAGLTEAVVEATNKVEAGYKPQIETIDKIIPEAVNV